MRTVYFGVMSVEMTDIVYPVHSREEKDAMLGSSSHIEKRYIHSLETLLVVGFETQLSYLTINSTVWNLIKALMQQSFGFEYPKYIEETEE
jgi:hypothetical protein